MISNLPKVFYLDCLLATQTTFHWSLILLFVFMNKLKRYSSPTIEEHFRREKPFTTSNTPSSYSCGFKSSLEPNSNSSERLIYNCLKQKRSRFSNSKRWLKYVKSKSASSWTLFRSPIYNSKLMSRMKNSRMRRRAKCSKKQQPRRTNKIMSWRFKNRSMMKNKKKFSKLKIRTDN